MMLSGSSGKQKQVAPRPFLLKAKEVIMTREILLMGGTRRLMDALQRGLIFQAKGYTCAMSVKNCNRDK